MTICDKNTPVIARFGCLVAREPGQFGPYYLRELINSGGMADIWLATDKDQSTFALRRLHDDLRSDSTSRKRFWNGCEVLSKIQVFWI